MVLFRATEVLELQKFALWSHEREIMKKYGALTCADDHFLEKVKIMTFSIENKVKVMTNFFNKPKCSQNRSYVVKIDRRKAFIFPDVNNFKLARKK